METNIIIEKYNLLSDDYKKKFLKFIDFLSNMHKIEEVEKVKTDEEKKKDKRIFGIAKGMFEMKDNFDEPLDEFKDYM